MVQHSIASAGAEADADAGTEAAPRQASDIAPAAGLILIALVGISCKQGGFYPVAQCYLAVVLALASIATLLDALRRGHPARLRLRLGDGTGPALLLAGWTLAAAGLHSQLAAGLRLAGLILAVVLVIAECAQLETASIELMTSTLLLLGGALALLGWFGVASHRSALAIPGQGLWRASATLTYPNAAAALLAILALLGLGLRCRSGQPASVFRQRGMLLTAICTGLGATLSRGGLTALAAGLLVLVLTLGLRRVLAAGWAPVFGALIALAGLLPSAAVAGPARPGLALLALALGLAVGAAAGSIRLVGITAAVAGLAALALVVTHRTALSSISSARLNLSSADRLAAWHAVWHQIALHPVTGSGPGLSRLSWTDPAGGLRVFGYAHDEYLQLFAELGLIGVLLLAGCLLGLLRVLRGCRPAAGADRTGWAVACAAVCVVAVSSLFDFTIHFPAVPLTAAALVGCAGSGLPARQSARISKERKVETR